jgi:hypothetical protein
MSFHNKTKISPQIFICGILATECSIYQVSYKITTVRYGTGDKYPCVYILAPNDGAALDVFNEMKSFRSYSDFITVVDVQACKISELPFFEKECLFHP